MRFTFRFGFYVGLGAALVIGLLLVRLWQPEHQINLHTEHLLRAIEHKNWAATGDFLGDSYTDQWNNDRATLLLRMREVFRYLRNVRFAVVDQNVIVDGQRATWRGKVAIDGDTTEVMTLVKERVNSLLTPFELEWRRMSGWPWDWKLVRVSNSSLEIPAGLD